MTSNTSVTIDLNEFIDIFDMPDTFLSFVHKKTGEIFTTERSDLSYFEDEEDKDDTFEDYPEWQQEALLVAKDIVHSSDDYLELPSQDSFDDYELMEEFCHSVENSKIQEKLLDATQGRGAFGRFKTALYSFGIENMWYKYRHEFFKALAIDWCQEQGFAYKYKPPSSLRNG